MSWAKFDDRCPSNPKVALLSDAALRLWFTAICYCCEHLTDGRIDLEVPTILPRSPAGTKLTGAIRELVQRGLWEETDYGWMVHDFLDWNPSGDAVREKREARAKAGRLGGQRSGKVRSKTEAIASPKLKQTSSKKETKTNPVPVPVPVPVPRENPPTPFSDPFGDSLRGTLATQRADVTEIFELWKKTFGFTGAKLVSRDSRAVIIAEAIDDHGLLTCKRVLAHAKNDGMVSGRDDDNRVKHEKISYIFGNQDTFARILRAADEAESRKPGSIASIMDRAKAREVAS